MRSPVRTAIAALSFALLAPSVALASAPPKRIVCQLEREGLVVEANFDKKPGEARDLRIFRQGPVLAQVARIAKEDVTAMVSDGEVQVGADREVGGQTKRVLLLSWSPKGSRIEVIGDIMPAVQKGESLPSRVDANNPPCTIFR